MIDQKKPLRSPNQVVFTNKARCRDCYRCLRVCEVKAIGMKGDQAFVDESRCIACGTCIRQCPQGAKNYRNDLQKAIKLLETKAPVAVSIAPSFAAVYDQWLRKRLPSALRKLGFTYVGETAVGAYHVARRTVETARSQPGQSHICSACPAVVRYVELYRPDLLELLVPVASPMIAHGRMLKERLGKQTPVVFIGPCVAKKAEAQRDAYQGIIDCVLTFEELNAWFADAGIHLEEMEESDFDESPEGEARFFPLAGGTARTGGLTSDLLDCSVLAVTGDREVIETLAGLDGRDDAVIIEPLFCHWGCVNGPAIGKRIAPHAARGLVLKYAGQDHQDAAIVAPAPPAPQSASLTCRFQTSPAGLDSVSEEQILAHLEQTGKARPEDQLNCSSCGYPSCREKARAVILGLAEPEMCLPRMRRLAEQRTDRIIETSPNGIIILDEHLIILHMNPTFQKFFQCSPAIIGKRINHLMDPAPFEKVALRGGKVDFNVKHDRYNLFCRQIIYSLPEEKQIVGLFVSHTSDRASQEKLDTLREQTVTKAQKLLDQQMEMARQIVQFLGESTARSEELVDDLLHQAQERNGQDEHRKRTNRPWDTPTLK